MSTFDLELSEIVGRAREIREKQQLLAREASLTDDKLKRLIVDHFKLPSETQVSLPELMKLARDHGHAPSA